mmetsp:Transcript_32130/g.88075  ORF Transcript_32130/g.88075 Transcript_32130/m.88075 type:complete len:193 (+) Transcript_32130:315-893(+)
MFGMFGRMWRGRVPTAAAALGAAMSPAAHAMGVSKHDAVQSYKEEAARAKQYSDAMKWVAEIDKRTAYAASILQLDGTDKLVWPLINAKSLKLWIDGKVNNETPWAAHRALTVGEEKDIVEAVKLLNLHGQAEGVDREQLTRLVMESLEMRPVLNRGRQVSWAREGRARARGSCPGVRGDLRACAVCGGGLD